MYVYQLLGICFYIGEFYDFIGLWTNEMDRIIVYLFLMGIGLIRSNGAITQDFYWRDFTPNDIPYDAIESNEGKYIGQVVYDGQILPATIYPHRSTPAVTIYNKKINIKDNVKILCSPEPKRFYWERVNFEKPDAGQLRNVIKGGYQGYNLYIGRMYHEEEWKIGKVIDMDNKALKGLWLWKQNGERAQIYVFDLLKYNSTHV